ncbi:MAG: prepilin-type N-terminal cleavage/methylation domain-containing protein [Acidobacteriota bacterium]|jgi:prepilin-type N-terminal cleavage/methylation domain-containing protein|nr:prepilin-type N-terminal cleavage/methylation domain-containing protein [Acidobacteriota bacterium]
MAKERGFSLVELLIVVAIIAAIAAIAIPNLLSAIMAAHEAAAVGSMRAYTGAQQVYSATNGGRYGWMPQLSADGYLDERWNRTVAGSWTGSFAGYAFTDLIYVAGWGQPFPPGGYWLFAQPPSGSGRYKYFMTGDGVVRYFEAMPGYSLPSGVVTGDPIGR